MNRTMYLQLRLNLVIVFLMITTGAITQEDRGFVLPKYRFYLSISLPNACIFVVFSVVDFVNSIYFCIFTAD